MEEKRIRNLALAGVGVWGKNLARNFYQLHSLHTICDLNEALLDECQKKYLGVNLTSNFNSILENPGISRVAIATPATTHYKLAKLALLAGKDVYVEKPLCLDLEEGEELIAIAAERKKILMIGHLLQYHPMVCKLQAIVANGELGKLQYIVSNRLNFGAIRTEENALWNFAPHDISVILSLCGNCLPQQVRCTGAAFVTDGVADTTMTTLQFKGGIRSHIYVSWLHPFKEQKLVVVGSDAMAVFDDTNLWEEKLLIYRNGLKWSNGTIPQMNKTPPERIEISQREPLQQECLHFIDCCDNRTPPTTDGAEGLRVLKVLQAAQLSLNADGEARDPLNLHSLKNKSKIGYFAHPTATIDPEAEIGRGAKIWHYSHIMDGAKVGPMCGIGQNVVVSPEVVLGKNVKVQNNVSIYTGVVCEDDVFLGPSMVFTNIPNPRSAIVRKEEYRKTYVRKGATIGANATILPGIELGEHCFVGAGAVVTKNVRPFAIVVGNPARQIGWASLSGNRLNLPLCASPGEVLEVSCSETGELYRLENDQLTLCKSRKEMQKAVISN